jgi:hypothetical protein
MLHGEEQERTMKSRHETLEQMIRILAEDAKLLDKSSDVAEIGRHPGRTNLVVLTPSMRRHEGRQRQMVEGLGKEIA